VVNLAVLYFLVEFTQSDRMLASFIAIELAILNNFVWNDLWTFGSVEKQKLSSRWYRLLSFNLISAGGVAINLGVFYILTGRFTIYYLVSQLIGILMAFGWNFLINRRLTWIQQ
jgi:dolichol-phosphate mannosyltransferase